MTSTAATAWLRKGNGDAVGEPDQWHVAEGPDDWREEPGQPYDRPVLYALPEGYTATPGEIDASMVGGGALRDERGRLCPMVDLDGAPMVVSTAGPWPVLRPAA